MEDVSLLREFIVRTLSEDIDPGSNYGDSLGSVFLAPFKDVATVIRGEIEKISAQGQSAVSKVINGVMTLIAPSFFDKKFKEIDKRAKDRISDVDNDPKMKAAWNAISPHAQTGISKMLFMADPVSFLTSTLVKKSPMGALNVVSTLLGPDQIAPLVKLAQQMDREKKGSRRSYEQIVKAIIGKQVRTEGVLAEADDDAEKLMSDIFQREGFARILRSSPVVKSLTRTALEVAVDVGQEYLKIVNEVDRASSLDEIDNVLGFNVDRAPLADLRGTDLKSAENLILKSLKAAVSREVVRSISDHLDKISLSDQDNPYFVYLTDIITKVTQKSV